MAQIVQGATKILPQLVSFAVLKTVKNGAFQIKILLHDEALFLPPQFGDVDAYQAIVLCITAAEDEASLFHALEYFGDSRTLDG